MLAPTYRAGVRPVSVECLHLTGPKQAKRGLKPWPYAAIIGQLQTYGARRCLLAFRVALRAGQKRGQLLAADCGCDAAVDTKRGTVGG